LIEETRQFVLNKLLIFTESEAEATADDRGGGFLG
jgi:hypothetical protein